MGERAAAPQLARPFVALLLGAMVASAVFVLEPWPLTSFRLFSHLRHDEQSGWAAATVNQAGEEEGYPLETLPGFRGFNFAMAEFEGEPQSRRDELCRTWVEAAPGLVGREAVEVRIYEVSWRLSERTPDGRGALPPERRLAYTCTRSGARAEG